MHGYTGRSKPLAASCQWHRLAVSPRPTRKGGRLAQSRTNSRPRRSVGVTAIVHRSADPTNPIEFEVRSHEWAPLQAACGEAAKASDAASLRVGPCRCSYRRLTQRVLFESAAGRTGSCSAGYAVLIAFVRGASTSRKLEGILTGWLPIKTPSALTDRRRMLRYPGWRGTGGEHSIAATKATVSAAKR
jgi:hypothetical protein